jgi:hypothetical protein
MSNQKSIDKLIKEYSYSLKFLPVMERQRLMLEIAERVQSETQDNNISLSAFLNSQGGKLHFLNSILHGAGFPVLKKLKRSYSLFKIFVSSFLLLTAASFISLYIFFKSYLPLFEHSNLDGSLTLFGGKMVFEPALETYFQNRHAYQSFKYRKDPLAFNLNSNINQKEFSKILINADELDILVYTHVHPFFKFNCETSKENYNVIVNNGELQVKLEGLGQCYVFLPPKAPIAIQATRGIVNVADINQDIDIQMQFGHVSWKKETVSAFQAITFELGKGRVVNRPRYTINQGWVGRIKLDEGDVRFR